jgi:hypothetical protein
MQSVDVYGTRIHHNALNKIVPFPESQLTQPLIDFILTTVQEALSLRSVWILPRWGRGSLSPLPTVLHVHFGQRL